MKKSYVLWSFVTMLVVLCGCSTSNSSSNKIYLPCQIKENGNWGFVTPEGDIICENRFKNEPTAVLDSVFFVEEGQETYSMYRLQENKPKLLLKDLTAFGTVVKGLVPICKRGKGIEVVDTHGRTKYVLKEIEGCKVIQCLPWFMDGYLLVIIINESGYENIAFVDENGRVKKMPQEYKLTNIVSGNIFQVYDTTKDCLLYVDRDGRILEWLESFNRVYAYTYGIKDYVICEKGGHVFIYTKDGKQILDCPPGIYDIELNGIKEGFILYKNFDWKTGVVDMNGKEILEPQYHSVQIVEKGFLVEENTGEWKILNKRGDVIAVLPQNYDDYYYVDEIEDIENFGLVAKTSTYRDRKYYVLDENYDPLNSSVFYRISKYPRQGADFIIFSIPTHTDWEEMGLKGKVKEVEIDIYDAELEPNGDYKKVEMESQEFISFSEEGLKNMSIRKHNKYGSYQMEYSYLNDTIYTSIDYSEDYWDKSASHGKYKEVKKYDNFGNLILHSKYNKNGEKTQEKTWHYNNENYLAKYNRYGANNELLASETWEYDDNNRLIMHTKQGEPEDLDEYGNYINLERCEKNYEYDENGKILEYDVYTLGGEFLRTVHYDSDGHKIDVDGNVTKTYDEKGRLISIVSRGDDNEIFFKESDTYNEDGKLTLQIQESLDKYTYTVPTWNKEIWKYLYKYDFRGNVISEIFDHVMTEGGTHLCSIKEYKIVYYE